MTELQGAVGLAQLAKLDFIVNSRRSWCERLNQRLGNQPGLLLPKVQEGCGHSWWFYILRVVPEQLGANADDFAAALKAEGLPASPHYIQQPLYRYPLFRERTAFERGEHPFARIDYSKVNCPNAEKALESCIVLSINEGYTDQDLEETVTAFTRVLNWFQAKRVGKQS